MNIRNLKNEQHQHHHHQANLKQAPSFIASSTFGTSLKTSFFPATGQQTKTVFTKLSNSSTSSIASSSSSIGSIQNGGVQPLINPFEETNRFRLEQSVLSPNLFHVANTSTPERDTASLWNIDQRAVLYPADIPIDESSLMAQYAHDYKLSKQVIPAVEAFWTQNKIIIESPLTGTTGSALRAKFAPMFHNNRNSNSSTKKFSKASSVNSPLTNELYNNFSSKKSNLIEMNKYTGSKLHATNTKNCGVNFLNVNSSESTTVTTTNMIAKSKNDQFSQTNLSIPTDFDLNKIPELKQFLLNDYQINELSPLKKDCQLNNSIRKKLFDQNSEDSSTATVNATGSVTNSTTPIVQSAILTKLKSADLSALKLQYQQEQNSQTKRISQLPKPEIYSSSDNDNQGANNKHPRTLASSSSSNTDDCWHDSFEFEDHQFASSPKYEKYSNIIHDIGGDFGCDDELSDSVFLTQHHKTPPDLSPLLTTNGAVGVSQASIVTTTATSIQQVKHNINSPILNESQMLHFSFEPISASKQQSATNSDQKVLSSPNLSPIRQQHESTNCTLKTSTNKKNSIKSKIKLKSSQLTDSPDELIINMSSSSQPATAKSIIFMDTGFNPSAVNVHPNVNADSDGDESKENKSFSESITQHHNHHKREEFYKQISFNSSSTQPNNDTYQKNQNIQQSNKLQQNANSKHLVSKNISINKPSLKCQLSNGSTSSSSNGNASSNAGNLSSKPFLLTTMTSMMSETTTNTEFNGQDSQDTGYQTNSVVNGSNTNTMNTMNINNPSIMIMDMTGNNMNELTNNYMFLSSTSTSLSSSHHNHQNHHHYHQQHNHPHNPNGMKSTNINSNTATSSTPMNLENDKENGLLQLIKPGKRPSLEIKNVNKNDDNAEKVSGRKNQKIKKNSISLNSLENIKPLEASTPEVLKFSFNSKSSFKPIVSSSSIWTSFSNNSVADLKKKVNFVKSKTTSNFDLDHQPRNLSNNYKIINNNTNKNYKKQHSYAEPTAVVASAVFCSNDYNDVSMSSNTSNLAYYTDNVSKLNDENDLLIKKHELDSLYVEQSILMNKISPSDYARTVLQKAKQDLKESIKFSRLTSSSDDNKKLKQSSNSSKIDS